MINFFKSAMFSVCAQNDLHVVADLMQRQIGKLPTIYLGLPLGSSSSKKDIWAPVTSKIQNIVGSWKNRTLSKAGRLTLFKNILSNIPVYFMSIKLPAL